MSTQAGVQRVSTEAAFALLEKRFGDLPFTSKQAAEEGVRPFQLRRLVITGALTSTFRSVFRIESDSHESTLRSRARELALVLPEGSAIVRRTAAWLYGVDPREPGENGKPLALECAVVQGRTPIRRPGVRSYQSTLSRDDVTFGAGLATTTPTRTAADLLRWTPPHMGLAVADAMARRVGVDQQDLLDCLGRWPGERHVRRARRLAGWLEPLSESFGESWLRLRILDAGFPRPTAQISIPGGDGRERYRLDLGWPELRIAIEYDGYEFHSGRERFQADQRRRQELADRWNWHVVGVGMGEVLGSGLTLERGIGELLGLEPQIVRRTW